VLAPEAVAVYTVSNGISDLERQPKKKNTSKGHKKNNINTGKDKG
jgi:hypothetical protein